MDQVYQGCLISSHMTFTNVQKGKALHVLKISCTCMYTSDTKALPLKKCYTSSAVCNSSLLLDVLFMCVSVLVYSRVYLQRIPRDLSNLFLITGVLF